MSSSLSLQGHNCFGAILHPITMADFLVAGPCLVRLCASVVACAIALLCRFDGQGACCNLSRGLQMGARPAQALDGYVSSFPSTYASKAHPSC